MDQTGAGTLPFKRIRPAAADVQLFDSMQSPLLSTGKLSRDGGSTVVCDIIPAATVLSGRTQKAVRRIITEAQQDPDNDDILMTVPFDPVSLTWRTVTPDGFASPRHEANNVHRIRSKKVLIDYHHRSAGYPTKKTWLAALNRGEYRDWPGLTPELVSKHLPEDTEETAAGHLHRRRQGVQSTNKPTTNTIKALEPIDLDPTTLNKDRTQQVGVHIVSPTDLELNGTISVDQTGKFPKISATGKQYIMVLYNYDTNGILVTGVKSRTAPHLIEAYEELYGRLRDAGIKPILQ